jgi:ADP-heptose:LPS heptosyltransferase
MILKHLRILKRTAYENLNKTLLSQLWFLNLIGSRITVVDGYGSPGDTILASVVCHNLKTRFPRLRINCITKNPKLLIYDPCIAELNKPNSFASIDCRYHELITEKSSTKHLLVDIMAKLNIFDYDKKPSFFFADHEIEAAKNLSEQVIGQPFLTINVRSKELLKTWSKSGWERLLELIEAEFPHFAIVQLGLDDEPLFGKNIIRLAGKLPIRDSVALQSLAQLHVGCVSFLMHTARAVNVPSVIIYGGRETPRNSGYDLNENIYSNTHCSPCWLHDSLGDVCSYDIHCMNEITPQRVIISIKQVLDRYPALGSPESR